MIAIDKRRVKSKEICLKVSYGLEVPKKISLLIEEKRDANTKTK